MYPTQKTHRLQTKITQLFPLGGFFILCFSVVSLEGAIDGRLLLRRCHEKKMPSRIFNIFTGSFWKANGRHRIITQNNRQQLFLLHVSYAREKTPFLSGGTFAGLQIPIKRHIYPKLPWGMTCLKENTQPHLFFEDVCQLDIRPPFHQKPKPLGGFHGFRPHTSYFLLPFLRDVSIVDLASQ